MPHIPGRLISSHRVHVSTGSSRKGLRDTAKAGLVGEEVKSHGFVDLFLSYGGHDATSMATQGRSGSALPRPGKVHLEVVCTYADVPTMN